jgi:hypothetical protein
MALAPSLENCPSLEMQLKNQEESGFSRIPSSFGLTRCFDVLKHVQSRSDDGGDAVMKLGQQIVFCYTVDKYFNLLLITFKTISLVHLTYPDFSY